ncbi:ABC transporter ATP-binding protein [Nanoarchaeota archaeon]
MVIIYFIMFTFAHLINFFEPIIVGVILNTIQEQGINYGNLGHILFLFSLFIIITFAFWIFHGPARVIEMNNSFLVRANYKKYLIDGTMALRPQWHTDHHSGDTFDKVEKGTHALYRFSSETFFVIEFIIRFVSSYIALAYFNLHSSYIVLFMVIMTFALIIKYDMVLFKHYRKLNWAENKISAKIYDVLTNITTVIILRIEKLVSKSIVKKIMYPFKLFKHTKIVQETKWFIVSVFSALMMFLVLMTYILVALGEGTVILVGTIYILYGYVQRIQGLFFRFAYKYGEIVEQKAKVDNAEEIATHFEKRKKIKQVKLNKWKKLDVKGLAFTYHTEDGADLHLKDINLTIKKGQRIALIGDSGSGKTTFMKLLRDLYTPNEIDLKLDGELLKKGFKELEDNITLIPQDPEIFNTTIKENITVGIKYPMSKVIKYTDMARFTDVAENLPKKFESSIQEKGVNLSGGEKQRLALARGLLASEKRPILLLDEPTSSVDSKNELFIYQNIFDEFKDKTIISSIHRLHLLLLFDKIYYFKKGKVIASGNFNELLEKSKEFKTLWTKYSKSDYLN